MRTITVFLLFAVSSAAGQELTKLGDAGSSLNNAVDLAIWGDDFAYSITVDLKLKVTNITNKESPVEIGFIGQDPSRGVLIDGDYLYVAQTWELAIYDLTTDPVDPVKLAIFDYRPEKSRRTTYRGLTKSDSHIFIALKTNNDHHSLFVLDKDTLSKVGSDSFFGTGDYFSMTSIAYMDGRVYCVVSTPNPRIAVFDVTNPASPSLVSTLYPPSGSGTVMSRAIAPHNGFIYYIMGDSRLVRLDPATGVSVFSSPSGAFHQCSDLKFFNSRLFAACLNRGLLVFLEEGPDSFPAFVGDGSRRTNVISIHPPYLYSGHQIAVYQIALPTPAPTPAPTPVPTPAPTPAPTPLPRWEIGCYASSNISRFLEYNGTDNTVESCVERCHSGGYSFAGVEFGSECWCGNSMSGAVRHIASDCEELECTGDSSTKCGGDGRMKVYQFTEPVAPHTPVLEGCFDDSVTERKLPHLAYTDKKLTNGECATICQSRGYKYSGTQDGSQCWCGDDISTSARVDPAKCSTACSGDSAQKCGGYLRGTVYRVVPMVPPHTPVLEGCFKDGRTRRLSHHAFSSPLNTVWECTRTCQHNGYKYAGLQYGKQCWCGDDLSTSTRTVMSQCDDPCSGDSTQTCGGGWRNQVYSQRVQVRRSSVREAVLVWGRPLHFNEDNNVTVRRPVQWGQHTDLRWRIQEPSLLAGPCGSKGELSLCWVLP
eukprot:TRINITY_DN50_c0_g1_i5.p1 TRINITY_DN50_c0_g1~~TRINITY_DN50_c0_g1_i5.p1  ORF type:complete len:706 (+),score=119.02 TRINITY_DN50_c0_g1_i5:55-2172(+)